MPTIVPFLTIEQELPSQLTLVSSSRRWLILAISILAGLPLSFLSFVILMAGRSGLVGAPFLFMGLLLSATLLLFNPTKFRLVIAFHARTVILEKEYWLGFGALDRIREKEWSFNDFTDARLVSQGWKKLVELKSNGKKVLLLDFGRKAIDAQRSYEVVQSWLKGLAPDSGAALAALQELENKAQNEQALKGAEKLLLYFGIFSLIDGAFGLYTSNSFDMSLSRLTMIRLLAGVAYLVCMYGVKRRFETALWVAIAVVLSERLYWFILSTSLRGSSWSSWLTWVFAFFVVSSLWQAIQSMRAKREEPVYEPLA